MNEIRQRSINNFLSADRTRGCQTAASTGGEKYEGAAGRSAPDEGRVPPRAAASQASPEAERGNDRPVAEGDLRHPRELGARLESHCHGQ